MSSTEPAATHLHQIREGRQELEYRFQVFPAAVPVLVQAPVQGSIQVPVQDPEAERLPEQPELSRSPGLALRLYAFFFVSLQFVVAFEEALHVIGSAENRRQGRVSQFKVIFTIGPFNHKGRLKATMTCPSPM